MDNFDKIFAKKLQEEQEFDFRASDWQEVADRLDTAMPAPVPTPFAWKTWAMAAILLSLLGVIGGLAYKLQDASKTIKELQNQPIADNFRVDTIYQEVAVVRVDTVYATKNITKVVNSTSYFSPTPFFATNQKFNTHDISVTGTGMLGTSFFSPFFNSNNRVARVSDQLYSGIKDISADNKENAAAADLNKLAILEGHPIAYGERQFKLNEISISELSLRNEPKFRDYLQPIGSKFGVSAGKSFLTAHDLTNVASSNIGLKGELQFVKNISLTGAVDWFKLSYQSTDLANLGREIPMPVAEDLGNAQITDLLFTAVDQSFTQYKMGLKYAFPTKTTARPYIGLNYLASSHFKKDFYYFFDVPPAQGFDVELTNANQFRRFNSDGFGLDLGVELQTETWLSFQIEGYYHFIQPSMRSQYYDLVGIRLAALVNFKR